MYGQYNVGDQVYWNGHTYTALQCTGQLDGVQQQQYEDVDSVPLSNVFPDDAHNGKNYWTDNGAYMVPAGALGSAATVIQYSAIDSIYYVTGDTICKIYGSEIELNGVEYDGLVMIQPLIDKINTVEKLANSINDNWNNFATSYSPGSPTSTGLSAALNVFPYTTPEDINPLTKQSDLENTTVKHGNGS